MPDQAIPVTLIVAAQATANPTALTFTTALGGPNPASQTITVGGVPTTSSIGATPSTFSCGSNWLTATVSGNTVSVGVVTGNLAISVPTTCTGSVAIIVPGATHLFEEPGALDDVVRLATAWFRRHLAPRPAGTSPS